MNWWILLLVAVAFLTMWKLVQRAEPIALDSSQAHGTDAVQFFWRPG